MRWLMLFLCCIFVVANYFCYDNPASVEKKLETELGITPSEYGLLYTVYAIPNCILPLAGGILIDKIGTRNGLILFAILLTAGQGIFMIGGYRKSLKIMLVGRAIFGIGCESMYVGQSAIVSTWFINFELPFAISMICCIPLIGSQLNGFIVPLVYADTQSFGKAFEVGFYMCIASLVLVIIISILDSIAEKHDAQLLKEFSDNIEEE